MKKSNFSIWLFLFAIASTFIITSCQKDALTDNLDKAEIAIIDHETNSLQKWTSPLPESTVELNKYTKKETRSTCPFTLSPSSFSASMQPEESVMELNSTCIENVPPKGDIIFMMDLTGSMHAELSNLKMQSINIMNSVGTLIPDSHFGVISHMDYPSYYSYCSYSGTYGISTDYPYQLDQSLTGNTTAVETSLNSLVLGDGYDYPESFARNLYEAANDPTVGWRDGSAKIVVAMLDDIPHSCSLGNGVDPGRDGLAGTADDLDMDDVLVDLIDQNIRLIVLFSNVNTSHFNYWSGVASSTGGEALQINTDGTIPGGNDLAVTITDLISSTSTVLNEVKLEANPASYNSWISSDPSHYANVDLSVDNMLDFDVTYTVPVGTTAGLYQFDIELMGDGAVYGSKSISIDVVTDADNDGCLDEDDPHPYSDTQPTIVIDGCDSGVPNQFVTQCSTMMDLINDCIEAATNHGQFMQCLNGLTNSWKSLGLISGKEKGKITKCGAHANIPSN